MPSGMVQVHVCHTESFVCVFLQAQGEILLLAHDQDQRWQLGQSGCKLLRLPVWGQPPPGLPFWHALPQVPIEGINILKNLAHVGQSIMASASELVSMKEVLAALPPIRATKAQQPIGGSSSSEAKVKLVEHHPFLKSFLQKEADLATAKGSSSSAHDDLCESDDEEGKPVPLTDDQVQEVFAALDAKSQEWEADGPRDDGDLRVTLLGSAWLMREKGKAYDAFMGSVRTGTEGEQFWAA